MLKWRRCKRQLWTVRIDKNRLPSKKAASPRFLLNLHRFFYQKSTPFPRCAFSLVLKVPILRPTQLYRRTYEGKPLPFFLYINAIDLVGIIPNDATYTPMHWRIYTSHTLDNVEQAKQVIQWYCWRWQIELLFATVKSSGLNLECALVEYGDKLKKLAVLVLMAAIQVIQLLQARDGQSQQMIIDCFSEEEIELIKQLNPKLEGNIQKQKNPHAP